MRGIGGQGCPRGRLGGGLHRGLLGLLFAALVLQLLKDQFDPSRRSLYVAAGGAGAAFAYLHDRGRFIPSVLTVLAPVPLVAVVWFLAFSSVASLVRVAGLRIV